MSLTEEQETLLQDVLNGQQGLADYGVHILRSEILYSGGVGHTWSDKEKLWVKSEGNAKLRADFIRSTREKLSSLEILLSPEDCKIPDAKTLLASVRAAIGHLNNISRNSQIWSSIESYLQSVPQKLNEYDTVLPLKGGKKIDLQTGEITERTREDFWSYEIGATGLDCSERAKEDNLRYFQNFFRKDGKVNQEWLDYLQKMLGNGLTFNMQDKSFCTFVGRSNTGKSHIFNRLMLVLGKRVASCSPDLFMKNYAEGNHQTYFETIDGGVSMGFISELEDGKAINGECVKKITGDDEIVYRPCYGKTMKRLQVVTKLFVGLNTMPKMNGGDSGLQTRLRIIPFECSQRRTDPVESKENEKMLRRLRSQDGINATFAWLVEGARKVLQDLEDGITLIEVPESLAELSEEHMKEADSFRDFVESQCDLWTPECGGKPSDYKYPRQQLQTAYVRFCKEHNITGTQSLAKGQVLGRLREMFPNAPKSGPWEGIRERPDDSGLPTAQVWHVAQ